MLDELRVLLPDTLLNILATEDGEPLIATLIDNGNSLAESFGIRDEAVKHEFVLHYVLSFLYARNGMLEQAQQEQVYIERLLKTIPSYRETKAISVKSNERIFNTNDARNWWSWDG